jgi:dipeptidyl aminopeptidase/acylaminoacyl peptidase
MKPAWPAFLLVAAAAAPPSFVAAQQEIVPNENLVVDGVPKIPASLAEAVGRYTEFRAASFASWHPTRREMLITTRFGDTFQVHRVRTPGGARTQLTFFPDRVASASYEPVSGGFFVFAKDKGGDEFAQLYRYDLATGTSTILTDGGRSQNGGVRWSKKGDRIAYASTRRNGKDRDIYVMDPRDPRTDRLVLTVEGGGWSPLDWSQDGTELLVGEGISANESHLWIADVATGRKTRLTHDETDPADYSDAVFAPDGKGVYASTDKGAEFHRLAYLDRATGRVTPLGGAIPWDVENVELARDGRTIAFVTNEDGVSVLRLFDTALGKEKPAPKLGLGPGVISRLEWRPDGRELAFSFASARTPSDVYSLDVAKGTVERWTESETGGLNAASFSEPELVRWKSFDGRAISGWLYKPPARFAGPRPVIVNIHGGPEGQYQPGFLGRSNYYLSELGTAMLFPNVRGSSGYGKTFLKLDDGVLREDSVKDIGALLDWIGTRPDLDAARIMITGGSYGGYMTLAAATHYSDRICCAVDIVGISNFITFMERTEAYRRDLRRVEYGDERDPKIRAFFEAIAPLHHAGQIKKPLFVVAGRNDPRVPYQEGEQMVATVKTNGTPVWFLMAKDEGHGFSKKRNQDFQFYATVAFIQEYLLPHS